MTAHPAIRRALAGLAVLSAVALPAAEKPAVLIALSTELARSMEVLGELPEPPYFLSYEVTEQDAAAASASFGTLTYSYQRRSRFLDVDLRVGDYELDNTRPIRSARQRTRRTYTRIPIEDDVDAIRSVVWNQTDMSYKQALQQLTKVRTDVAVKVDAEDQSADFSREEAQRNAAQPAALAADVADWEAKVKRYTAPFAAYGDIYRANAGLSATVETRWFVNSEGAEIQTSETRYRLSISAQTKADDGMTLPRYESFSAFSIDGLPDDDTVLATVERMIADLRALRDAPVVDPYTGPAILSGRASGVFFHEILGHRAEGHRQKRVDDGQTFKKKIDEQILPAGFTVSFDPTRRAIVDTDLVGAYEYDNQGVRAQRVDVVQDGVFKRFLMSRTPIEGFSNSNGHGRKQTGYQTVSRQSNLIVEVAEPLTREALKERLMAMLKEQDKPFGLLFDDIQGGVTTTGRSMPNAFNVQPILVYRIYPDGREELVRGVDLIGTPLTTLSHVTAADDQLAVFNGICGAESGGVPVSAVSPAILVSQIEVQKKRKSQERTPILPPPFDDADIGETRG